MTSMRFAFGMLSAPLVAALVWVGIVWLRAQAMGASPSSAAEFGTAVVFTCVYTYPIGWVLGLLAYAGYTRLGLHSLRSYLLGGLIVGTAAGIILIRLPPVADALVMWLGVGFAASLSCGYFWMVAIHSEGRPNKPLQPTRAASLLEQRETARFGPRG